MLIRLHEKPTPEQVDAHNQVRNRLLKVLDRTRTALTMNKIKAAELFMIHEKWDSFGKQKIRPFMGSGDRISIDPKTKRPVIHAPRSVTIPQVVARVTSAWRQVGAQMLAASMKPRPTKAEISAIVAAIDGIKAKVDNSHEQFMARATGNVDTLRDRAEAGMMQAAAAVKIKAVGDTLQMPLVVHAPYIDYLALQRANVQFSRIQGGYLLHDQTVVVLPDTVRWADMAKAIHEALEDRVRKGGSETLYMNPAMAFIPTPHDANERAIASLRAFVFRMSDRPGKRCIWVPRAGIVTRVKSVSAFNAAVPAARLAPDLAERRKAVLQAVADHPTTKALEFALARAESEFQAASAALDDLERDYPDSQAGTVQMRIRAANAELKATRIAAHRARRDLEGHKASLLEDLLAAERAK